MRWLTPRMLRVVLGGPELADFDSTGSDQRIKLCLPRPGRPTPLGRDRAEVFALPREQQPKQRTYTVRWFDPAAHELAIDFVVHEHEAPGASWISTAATGDQVVAVGPSPSYAPDRAADRLVLAGDETALPAMLAMVGELAPQARVQVFAEVADAAEEQEVRTEADVSWTWLHRDGVAAGRSTLLEDAVRAADLGPRPDVWAGAESAAVQRIRVHCQDVLGLDRRRVYALAYWRLDATGP